MRSRLPQRLLHRIPVRIRHYWKLLAVCAAFLVACAVVFSTVRVAPLVTSPSDNTGDQVVEDVAGTTDLFDETKAHTVTLTFKDADYQRLLDEFWDEGEKEFLEADITIDGTRLDSVGIRLKGNSTLSGLTRNGQSRPGGFGPGGRQGGQLPQRNGNGVFPGGGLPGGLPGAGPQGGAAPGGAAPGGAAPGGFRPGGGFGMSSLKAEEPETLPWLIRFDEFVDGRRYQGHREIAVRVAGMGGGSTVLNEAVSLNVLAAADQTAQRYAYTSFTVNDRPTTARLIVEHPDEDFADTLGGSGVLYKSLATSQFTDQGDDPTDYADDFKQITKKGSQDLQPVIDLIQWVNSASAADFDKHLAEHVDVGSFANYVAAQNLLLNGDDMAGPGRNYYLWYDLRTKRFSVVGWDYNLSFSGSATTGPHDSTSMGGGRGFGGMGGNKLKERFLASTAFKATYDDAYRSLYKKIYAGADALNILDGITKVLGTVEGNNADRTRSDAETLRDLIVQRTEHLAGDAVITGG
ncbi:CotH kinase family protein [Dactylosporangium siamense]|uniref:Spore coat protein CotH n=1 Tax=Dactylosporangium siamense TaxID=685454 RepID=A0A919U5C1_9ACTN|nr:CotH kinase family protein [Dactylosporangium siamense]GIG43104.1 hypothetical protein Dsi01nite_011450 [Dactylosporangium siamense]